MAATRDENARRAIGIFKDFAVKPGEDLALRTMLRAATSQGWPDADLIDGLEHGEELGWFEVGSELVRLTEAGHKAM